MQKTCGSGPLVRKINPIYNGYECLYYALDTEGVGPGQTSNGDPILGLQSKLLYFTGQDIGHIRKEIEDVEKPDFVGNAVGGFYTVKQFDLPLDRKGQEIGVWAQNGSLSIGIRSTEIDYELYDLPKSLECSTEEFFGLRDQLMGRASAGSSASGTGGPLPPKEPKSEAPAATTTQGICCEIIVADVVGAVETRKGEAISHDQRLGIGDKLYAFDATVVIGVVCSDDPDNVKIFVIEVDEPSEISIVEGPDGKPTVVKDPGVATVSVKELPQFETDFQVSTPRLTCSVRG